MATISTLAPPHRIRQDTTGGAHRTTWRRILAYMQQHPGPHRAPALVQALGLTPAARMVLKRMVDAGVLERFARGVYGLPEA